MLIAEARISDIDSSMIASYASSEKIVLCLDGVFNDDQKRIMISRYSRQCYDCTRSSIPSIYFYISTLKRLGVLYTRYVYKCGPVMHVAYSIRLHKQSQESGSRSSQCF